MVFCGAVAYRGEIAYENNKKKNLALNPSGMILEALNTPFLLAFGALFFMTSVQLDSPQNSLIDCRAGNIIPRQVPISVGRNRIDRGAYQSAKKGGNLAILVALWLESSVVTTRMPDSVRVPS